MAVAKQEATMPYNAVAHLAKSREVDKKPFLEQRRDRVVEIARLGKLPKPLNELGRIRG